MEDLKVVFASNLIKLRTRSGMTQAELAAKINYSDKSVSKWERAETLPDVSIVKSISQQFGVTVDFMLNVHDEREFNAQKQPFSTDMVTAVIVFAIWTLAALLFSIFWIIGQKVYLIFVAAVPVSLIAMLILNGIWNRKKHNDLIVAGIVLSIFGVIYYALIAFNPWQLLLVVIPAEAIVFFSFKIKSGLIIGKKAKNGENR